VKEAESVGRYCGALGGFGLAVPNLIDSSSSFCF